MLHTIKSLKNTKKKSYFIKKIKYIVCFFFSMHFGFDNQFIESIRM